MCADFLYGSFLCEQVTYLKLDLNKSDYILNQL